MFLIFPNASAWIFFFSKTPFSRHIINIRQKRYLTVGSDFGGASVPVLGDVVWRDGTDRRIVKRYPQLFKRPAVFLLRAKCFLGDDRARND